MTGWQPYTCRTGRPPSQERTLRELPSAALILCPRGIWPHPRPPSPPSPHPKINDLTPSIKHYIGFPSTCSCESRSENATLIDTWRVRLSSRPRAPAAVWEQCRLPVPGEHRWAGTRVRLRRAPAIVSPLRPRPAEQPDGFRGCMWLGLRKHLRGRKVSHCSDLSLHVCSLLRVGRAGPREGGAHAHRAPFVKDLSCAGGAAKSRAPSHPEMQSGWGCGPLFRTPGVRPAFGTPAPKHRLQVRSPIHPSLPISHLTLRAGHYGQNCPCCTWTTGGSLRAGWPLPGGTGAPEWGFGLRPPAKLPSPW